MDHCSLLPQPSASDLDGTKSSNLHEPFRTLTCTAEYPLVTFLTLLTTFDILPRGRDVSAIDAAFYRLPLGCDKSARSLGLAGATDAAAPSLRPAIV